MMSYKCTGYYVCVARSTMYVAIGKHIAADPVVSSTHTDWNFSMIVLRTYVHRWVNTAVNNF